MQTKGRTELAVHLDRLAANVEKTRALLPAGTDIIAVLKADGYGLGAAGIWSTLHGCGIRKFAVAYWQEGAALRAAGLTDEIYLLADVWDDELPMVLEHRLIPAVFDAGTAARLNGLARAAGVVLPVQLKIDTGMRRIGLPWGEDALPEAKRIAAMKNLRITGAFTHFAKADSDPDETKEQLDRFLRTAQLIRAAGIELDMLHAANSAAVILRPGTALDAVRVGDMLFGLITVDDEPWDALGLEEIMSWSARVSFVKTVPAGSAIGYGGTYVTERETVVATIPVGYADGYSRRLSNRGRVVIRGREAPVIGRVCMDQFMADVTDIPDVCRGDEAVLLGEGMTIRRISEISGVSVDELACGITSRVPRVYVGN